MKTAKFSIEGVQYHVEYEDPGFHDPPAHVFLPDGRMIEIEWSIPPAYSSQPPTANVIWVIRSAPATVVI